MTRFQFLAQTLAAVVLSLGVTAAASVFFHGAVHHDYLVTGVVAALLVNAVIAAADHRMRLIHARLEAEVAERTRDLEAARAAAAVAHEVKNPLAAILGNLELAAEILEADRGAADTAEMVRAVRQATLAARHLEALVRDLRATGEDLGAVDVRAVVDEAASLARPHLPPGARVENELGAVAAVSGARSRLVQVFLNLLVNAALASRPETENVVRVTGEQHDGRLVITVADRGTGMPPEVLARVFEAGFTTRAGRGGSGLGMSIVKGIVESGGGTIAVDSHLGQGTTVRISLPVHPVAKDSTGRG